MWRSPDFLVCIRSELSVWHWIPVVMTTKLSSKSNYLTDFQEIFVECVFAIHDDPKCSCFWSYKSNHKKVINNSVRTRAACETMKPAIAFKPSIAKQKGFAQYVRALLTLASPSGQGGVGFGFASTDPSAEGIWEGLGFEYRRRHFLVGGRFYRFLQTRGCAKQKSLCSVSAAIGDDSGAVAI